MTFEEWQEFHHELDLAVATYMIETGKLPSKVTLMDFMEFSAKKCGFGLRHFLEVNLKVSNIDNIFKKEKDK